MKRGRKNIAAKEIYLLFLVCMKGLDIRNKN